MWYQFINIGSYEFDKLLLHPHTEMSFRYDLFKGWWIFTSFATHISLPIYMSYINLHPDLSTNTMMGVVAFSLASLLIQSMLSNIPGKIANIFYYVSASFGTCSQIFIWHCMRSIPRYHMLTWLLVIPHVILLISIICLYIYETFIHQDRYIIHGCMTISPPVNKTGNNGGVCYRVSNVMWKEAT